jgi:hypothetical protein
MTSFFTKNEKFEKPILGRSVIFYSKKYGNNSGTIFKEDEESFLVSVCLGGADGLHVFVKVNKNEVEFCL